jgi:hypothetical protein
LWGMHFNRLVHALLNARQLTTSVQAFHPDFISICKTK